MRPVKVIDHLPYHHPHLLKLDRPYYWCIFTSLLLPSISLALGARLPRLLLCVFCLLGDGITGGCEERRLVLVEGAVGVVVVGAEGGLEHGQ